MFDLPNTLVYLVVFYTFGIVVTVLLSSSWCRC